MLKCIIIYGILIIGCHFQNQNIQSHLIDPIVVNPIPEQVVAPNADHIDPIVVANNLNVDVKNASINIDQKSPQQINVATAQIQPPPPSQNLQHTQAGSQIPAQGVPQGTPQNMNTNTQANQATQQVTSQSSQQVNAQPKVQTIPQQNSQLVAQPVQPSVQPSGQPTAPSTGQPTAPSTGQPTAQPIPQPIGQPIPSAVPQSQQQLKRLAKQQYDLSQALALQAQHQAQAERKARSQKQLQQLRQYRRRPNQNQALSRTQDRKQEEEIKFKEQQLNIEDDVSLVEHVFQIENGVLEFYLNIPATQEVYITFYSYISEDNTYIRTNNIDEQGPVQVYIFQNNQKLVSNGNFYFQLYLTFMGNQDHTYMIRIFNIGSRTKLISMSTKKLVEKSHIQKILNIHEVEIHGDRTQKIATGINKWFQQFRRLRMLDFKDLKVVENHITKYYSFEIFQTIVCVIVSILQIQMIQKMLTANSIV